MDHISEYNNSLNKKILSHDQISKMVVNLGSKKCDDKYNSKCQLTCLHNLLVMSIFDTIQKYLANFDPKSEMRNLHTSSVKSSSALPSLSIHDMYSIVYIS